MRLSLDDSSFVVNLKRMAASRIGSFGGPFRDRGLARVDLFLRDVAKRLDRLPDAHVLHAEYDHLGARFASFIEIFLADRDTRLQEGDNHVRGIKLYLCRLGPFAAFAPSWRFMRMERGWPEKSSSVALDVNDLRGPLTGDGPDPDWYARTAAKLGGVLKGRGLTQPEAGVLANELPFESPVPRTVLRRPPYRVWDAMFHWSD